MSPDLIVEPSPTVNAQPVSARGSGKADGRRRSPGSLWETWGISLVLLLLAGVASLISPDFMNISNLQSILRESAYLGIVAAGMTFAIMSGTFDLSVGGQLALVSVVSLMGFAAGGTLLAVFAAVATGLACGLVNSALITVLRVPAFVATLGMLFVFRGIAYILTGSGPRTIPYSHVGATFTQLGSLNVGIVPLPFALMLVTYAAAWVVLRRTATGRRLVALGSSPEAARFCGISLLRMRLFVFTLVGLCVGIAALTYVTRVWTADGSTQDGFELRVIAAVVLGGTSLRGGKGTLMGTFSAVLLVGVLNNLLVAQGVAASYQRVVLGLVLITALAIDGLRARFASPGSLAKALGLRRLRPHPPTGGAA